VSVDPKTKNILVIIAAVGAIIIGSLLIYGILVTPTRQPYRDALTQYENVNRANDALNVAGSKLNAGEATDEAFKESISKAQTALTSLRTENTALSKEEALKDGEGKAAYEAFDIKLQPYLTYNENVLVSMLKVRPALLTCSKNSTSVTETQKSVDDIRACVASLDVQKDIPDSDYAQLVVSFKSDYSRLADILQQIVALKDPKGVDSAQHKELTDELTQATEELSTTSTTFTRSVQQHRSEVLPVSASKQLESYLSSKSRLF